MAITVTTISKPFSTGDRFKTVSSIALDNSYVTGGYPLSKNQLGLASTVDPEFNVELDSANGWSATYDYVNAKLMLWATANVQVTNATDVSSITALRVVATGKYRA